MNNLLSHCGFVDARISASGRDQVITNKIWKFCLIFVAFSEYINFKTTWKPKVQMKIDLNVILELHGGYGVSFETCEVPEQKGGPQWKPLGKREG